MDENVIYIIIAIIWIVSSILKAVNKKPKKENTQQTARPTTHTQREQKPETLDDFKKILEDIIAGKQSDFPTEQADEIYEEEIYENETVPNAASNKYSEYQGKTDYEFNKYESLESIFETKSNFEVLSTDNPNEYYNNTNLKSNTSYSPVLELEDPSELRKAVIYAEILKRPEY